MSLGLLDWIFGRREPDDQDESPPRPPDWNLTLDDLGEELESGKRRILGQPEIDWARDYERSLIPEGVRFPRDGDVYASLEDRTVSYMTAWAAPFSGGGEGVLKAGERVRISGDFGPEPISVYAVPVEYDEIEARMVPEEERRSRKYGGFYLSLRTMELHEAFERVDPDEASDKE